MTICSAVKLSLCEYEIKIFSCIIKFIVNGKKANIPSMRLKVGDVIQMRDSIKNTPAGKDLVENLGLNNLPAWLELDAAHQSVKVARMPQREEIDIPVEEQMIVELYSK